MFFLHKFINLFQKIERANKVKLRDIYKYKVLMFVSAGDRCSIDFKHVEIVHICQKMNHSS
ncbi:hypothetical protein DWU89_13475 [Parabacteroides acidifaciens]|uniref:Uncharacterized protein n=1 Tax=Parabacteroides acidifaciens TaxID=2290935 RepID=A0A3D8HCD1_9BACT|nr:hypothetical protein DWU89_13475 [Parabacteroides acidifaciens]